MNQERAELLETLAALESAPATHRHPSYLIFRAQVIQRIKQRLAELTTV